MLPHIWYKVIPSSSSEVDYLAFLTGQSWEMLQPLLVHLKYLVRYKDVTRINILKFEELQHYNLSAMSIHMGTAHPNKSNLLHYICKDKPSFFNPTAQNNITYFHAILRYCDRYDSIFKNCIIDKLTCNSCSKDIDTAPLHNVGIETSVNKNDQEKLNEVVIPTPTSN